MKKLTTAEFIERARKVHGDKYIYDKVEYKDTHTPVKIICPEHGEFWQTATNHLQGQGCPICGIIQIKKSKTYDTTKFIEKARQVHGNKYDYSKVNYIDSKTKVCIICPEHGEFWQRPSKHLSGQKCPECAKQDNALRQTRNTSEFVKLAKKIHNNKYDYSKVHYIKSNLKVCIICPEHGEFWQRPDNHLQGYGCPVCGGCQKSDTDSFLEKAQKVHGDKYDYSKTLYLDSSTKVCIICPEHGEFWQTPEHHLRGCGCPKCAHTQSRPEQEIIEYLKQYLKPEQIKRGDRELLDGKEIDILLPDFHIGIEYNGLYWHNLEHKPDINYHRDKMLLANSKGYRLIQIFEDEWIEHKNIVFNKLRHFVGGDAGEPTIGARKCTIRQINKQIANNFLSTYHIQGFVASSLYLGAYYNEELVGVMTFKEEKSKMWNLTRFATKTDYKLPGLASKMFKYFVKNYEFEEIKSFLDLRWNQRLNGNTVYDKLGFVLTEIEKPDYRYVVRHQRIHKFNMRKQSLNKNYGLPLIMTEREMCDKLGFIRIYDCGLAKYVYHKF